LLNICYKFHQNRAQKYNEMLDALIKCLLTGYDSKLTAEIKKQLYV